MQAGHHPSTGRKPARSALMVASIRRTILRRSGLSLTFKGLFPGRESITFEYESASSIGFFICRFLFCRFYVAAWIASDINIPRRLKSYNDRAVFALKNFCRDVVANVNYITF